MGLDEEPETHRKVLLLVHGMKFESHAFPLFRLHGDAEVIRRREESIKGIIFIAMRINATDVGEGYLPEATCCFYFQGI